MRMICKKCQRPKSACFCPNIIPQGNEILLTILVHPDEQKHSLGTAKMAELTFHKTMLFTGLNFTNQSELTKRINDFHTVVLYPHENALDITQRKVTRAIEHIIIIDGSWRKAKRILHENSFLQNISKIQLGKTNDSIYQIRKAPRENQLSTIEAIVQTLNVLEKKDFNSALKVLEKQVELHKNFMGKKYEKFYKTKDYTNSVNKPR
jgi:DTW domain-containing protein YfiP